MKLSTFYKIYYSHRIKKSSFFLTIYIFLTLPFTYIINKLLLESLINLDEFSKKNQYLFKKDLKFLFQFFNSDKGEAFKNQYQKPVKLENNEITGHKYHKFYEKFLSNKKDDFLDILEIGTFKGNATAAFYFYFKNSKITSVDIFPDLIRYKSNRITNFYLDNSKESDLQEKILSKNLQYDLIIEDAGHYYKDQIISLFSLFENLRKDGIFVVEELDFPDTRHDMNIDQKKPTLRDILFSIQNKKDFDSELITHKQKKFFLENYKSIEIFNGQFNQIAFIVKK